MRQRNFGETRKILLEELISGSQSVKTLARSVNIRVNATRRHLYTFGQKVKKELGIMVYHVFQLLKVGLDRWLSEVVEYYDAEADTK